MKMPKFKVCIELNGYRLTEEEDIIEARNEREAERRVREYAEASLETWAEPVEEGNEDD